MKTDPWQHVDWKALERLRRSFLAGTAGSSDYWRNENDLASYDTTFAQRIGWKWDSVLRELTSRGWRPPGGTLLDWGCGSGIASRAVLDGFGCESFSALYLFDKSAAAMRFARNKARAKYPDFVVETGMPDRIGMALISHVQNEMTPDQLQTLVDEMAEKASVIVWVEPGTFEASLFLIAVRERLRSRFSLVAPCTHQAACGILAPGNERDWCHHFAPSPGGVHLDPNWGKFAALMGIDLRSLPVSYLVLDNRRQPKAYPNLARVIGRPRIYKGFSLVCACRESGVCQLKLTKRDHPEECKLAKKDELPQLAVIESEGDKITRFDPIGVQDAGGEP